MNDLYIQNNLVCRSSEIWKNKALFFKSEENDDLKAFLKKAYQYIEMDYPKFFKMDNLSKLAILNFEILIQNEKIQDPALVFANSNSSLDTDQKFQKSTATFASPALFVYTLPNIMLGEISIKHTLRSENIFLISKEFNPSLYTQYVSQLFQDKNISETVCGWVDLHNSEYDVLLCRITRNGEVKFTEENLQKLYDQPHE
ncbi:hypothetical protein [Gramella sp. AN32]|uniref:3-oxoacyl-ACP synthase n=1 Tax=Christiangramia antarctica TaxID=2058158 RepID=A0ABW5X0N3_9FLAO|nr:hypothetical protein [Gramella sp. AN32]MCM4156759.1 hypothetical protein [Gramella sp. AN32]